jgi:hypothetical protein
MPPEQEERKDQKCGGKEARLSSEETAAAARLTHGECLHRGASIGIRVILRMRAA